MGDASKGDVEDMAQYGDENAVILVQGSEEEVNAARTIRESNALHAERSTIVGGGPPASGNTDIAHPRWYNLLFYLEKELVASR